MTFECEYVLGHIHSYFGWHIRGFSGKELAFEYTPTKLGFDPCESYLEDFLNYEKDCAISRVNNTSMYIVIRSHWENLTVVIGPLSDIRLSKNDTYNDLIQSGFSPEFASENIDKYYEYRFNEMSSHQIKTFNIVMILNYIINKNKIDASDIFNDPDFAERLVEDEDKIIASFDKELQALPHNTYEYECELYSYITAGNVDGFREFSNGGKFKGNVGRLSDDSLRNTQNLAHAAITLASRAAMRGGANIEQCYTLSDQFFRQIEEQKQIAAVYYLQNRAMIEFTELVAKAKRSGTTSRFASDVHQYIIDHIDQKITTEDLSEQFGMNRTSLCKKFKQLTGKNLASFISEVKLDEAKRLLSGTDSSLVSIANHLAFSSQSHFQNSFKKYTGMTPTEFRKNNTNTIF